MRAAPVLLASLIAFAAIEGAVFHSGLYPWILSPDGSTGYLETILRNERMRPKSGPQVLGIGDSRMSQREARIFCHRLFKKEAPLLDGIGRALVQQVAAAQI